MKKTIKHQGMPLSISRKIRASLRLDLQKLPEEPNSISPQHFRARAKLDYLQNLTPSPACLSFSPVKIKQLSPKSLQVLGSFKDQKDSIIHYKAPEKFGSKAKSTSLNRSLREKRSNEKVDYIEGSKRTLLPQESIEFIPENSFVRNLFSPSSTSLLRSRPFSSLKTFTDLKYLISSAMIRGAELKMSALDKRKRVKGQLPSIQR